jgi:hypothetical protein
MARHLGRMLIFRKKQRSVFYVSVPTVRDSHDRHRGDAQLTDIEPE